MNPITKDRGHHLNRFNSFSNETDALRETPERTPGVCNKEFLGREHRQGNEEGNARAAKKKRWVQKYNLARGPLFTSQVVI